MAFRLVQISDVHLSRRRPFFQHNWEVLVEILNGDPPDLVVCTGDMTYDGCDDEPELAYAAEEFRRLRPDVLFVPGNHDIGNSRPDVRGGETLITDARRDAYIGSFGPDFWMLDVERWRLLGLNSMLFGSGLPAEAEQETWLAEAVASRGRRRLLVLMHKPLYLKTPDEPTPSQGALYPEQRARLRGLLAGAGSAVIATGHLHDYKRARWDQLRQIWAPSAAFVIDARGVLNPRYGVRRVGYLQHGLDGRHHSLAFIEPDGFVTTDLGNWMRSPQGFHARYAVEPLRGLGLLEGRQPSPPRDPIWSDRPTPPNQKPAV